MRLTFIAAAVALMTAAAPVLAAEQALTGTTANVVDRPPAVDTGSAGYQRSDGQVMGAQDRAPATDTGSAGYQRADGPAFANAPERMITPQSSESEPESANSLPRGF